MRVKLSHRLTLVLLLMMVAVVGVLSWLLVCRERVLIEASAKADLSSIGHTVRQQFIEEWRSDGPSAALGLLHTGDGRYYPPDWVSMRWVRLEDLGASLAQVKKGAEVAQIKGDHMQLYIPVQAHGIPPGALELSRSLHREHEYLHHTVEAVGFATVLLALMLGTLILLLSRWVVARPLELLAAQARKIAGGQLDARTSLRRSDEIGVIALEMNRMADALTTAKKNAATEQLERLSSLEELRHIDRLATVGKLAAGVAHELGTPLSVVGGRAKLISSGAQQGPAAMNSARIVAEQADRMTRIIRQLMDFARRKVGPKVRTDIVELARKTLAMLSTMARKQSVELKLIEPQGPEEAIVEVNQVEQALVNLIVNGIQSMRAGGTLTVDVHEKFSRPPPDLDEPPDDYICVEVSDQGEGISSDNLPHVFDPFFTTRPMGEGTGLGLSVAYGIAREHHGWIDAVSQPGAGSRFAIHLPLARNAAHETGAPP
jgi:two-component system NtrC family sensor kinase